MLNSRDLATLIEMVKGRLESLVLQRSGEERTNHDSSPYADEIDNLYRLLAKLITLADGLSAIDLVVNQNENASRLAGSHIMNERAEFIHSLRAYWSSLNFAVNSAIQYTRNGEPQRLEFDRICVLLAQCIDSLRMFYTNIKKSPDDHGLYPFEPIKAIYESFMSLGYGLVDQSVRESIRDQITESWKSMREPFLSEFDRTTPEKPVSPFIRK